MKLKNTWLVIISAVFMLASCGRKQTKDMLAGTWQGKDFASEMLENIDEEEREIGRQFIQKISYTFNEDGTCIKKAADGQNNANWQYNDSSKIIIITYTDKHQPPVQEFEIKSITDKELKISSGPTGFGTLDFIFEKK
jgi:hypothetical protein